MADTLQFELVSPERRLASIAATHVQIPGTSGDFTAMPLHAPFLSTLRPGIVKVVAPGETTEYVVTGGFAEVSPEGTTILAEQAVPRASVTREMVAELVAGAEKSLADAPQESRLAAAQRLNDARALGPLLGL